MGCSVPKPEGSMQTPAEAMHAVALRCLVAPTLHIAPKTSAAYSTIAFLPKKTKCFFLGHTQVMYFSA